MGEMAKYPGLIEDRRRNWTVRVRVPRHLQNTLGRRELWRSTETAVKAEAVKRYPLIKAELDALVLDAERKLRENSRNLGPPSKASDAELHQLVRAWFHRWNQKHDADFDAPASDEERNEILKSLREEEAFTAQTIEEPHIQQVADRFITEHGIAVEHASRDWWKVVRLMQAVSLEFIRRERARVNGAAVEHHFDPLFEGVTANGLAPQPTPTARVDNVFDAWAKERRFPEKTRYSWKRILQKLVKHLGHDNATSITEVDVIAWKDGLVASRLAPRTVQNHLIIVKAFFRWAAKNKRIAANPAADVEYRPKLGPNHGRLSYSDDDATRILLAARSAREAHKRWVPWLCAFTGARIDEICGAMVSDIGREGDVHYIRIDPANREEGGSVKNKGSIRNVPLHPALIDEGFLEYLKGLKKTGPLFPDVPPDRFGKRGGNGQKTIGRWVRQKVGIKDKRKAPNHSWRHRFADECRKVGIPREIRFALDGHAAREVGDRYGSEGYPLAVLAEAIAKLPIGFLQPVARAATASAS